MLLDRFGPRITFSSILVYTAFPTLAFACAQDFNQLVLILKEPKTSESEELVKEAVLVGH